MNILGQECGMFRDEIGKHGAKLDKRQIAPFLAVFMDSFKNLVAADYVALRGIEEVKLHHFSAEIFRARHD